MVNGDRGKFLGTGLGRCFGAFVALVWLVIPVSTAAADPTYGVMNASGGIYWRSAPDWNTPVQTVGFGFYPDTVIAVHCYQAGAGNVPGSADYMWEYATDVGGSGYGTGWINEHFINDGQPINVPSPGVPPCGGSAEAPPPASPAPPPTSAGLIFSIVDAAGGVYYRRSPSWADAIRTPGVGIYNGDRVELICGTMGDSVGPYANRAWSRVRNLTRQSEGWVNEHFINDGAPANTFVAGEPMCGGSSTASGRSLYFSPYPENPHGAGTTDDIKALDDSWAFAPSPATVTMHRNQWDRDRDSSGCPKPTSFTPRGQAAYDSGQISTLAAWSAARAAPFVFLAGHPDWQARIHYIVLFDPGNRDEWAQSKCAQEYHLSIILREWLIANPSNKLVIFAGEITADAGKQSVDGHGHAGIQNALFVPLKVLGEPPGRKLRSQIAVCSYVHMSHTAVWQRFKREMNQPPVTRATCPSVPNEPVVGWNP